MEMPTPSSSVDHSEVVSSTTRTTSVSRRRSPPLHDAALNGDITLVSQMLNAGEDPDTRDEWSLTPIMSMFVRHALQDTRCIFQERHAVRRNLVTDGGKTALHYAICDGLYEVARTLLDAGASIDAQDKGGRSPLYCAVQERSLSVTNLLISYGASIDLQDKNGISPLSLVIEKGYLDVMQILLNHHELVATRERLDFTGEVLLQAAEVNSVEIVRLLLESEYVALDYQNAAGETAMLRAIAQGKTQMMEALNELDSTGQSLCIFTFRGESCFHFAARMASVKELELLFQFRARLFGDMYQDLLDSTDSSGATPLFAAATTTESCCVCDKINQFIDRKDKIQLLLSNGAMLLRNEVLPGGSPFRRLTRDPGVILCVQELCSNWIVHVPAKPETASMMTVLNLSVCVGYAIEVLPLLLMLPQQQAAITSFLQSLDNFKSCSNGLQFERLALELSASWASAGS
ncbi:hypothetical protein PC129_g11159 [Phytophthora cactorum]|uniref:Ankyrin repeat-containing domain n=1 Tax=Phytophthora cactorum TaxID=29920 RepID=A0A8T1I0W3_9STRA|nr:hypothetical protein PC129_g11159 [Phytophthora cactorum]